jgi:tRNA pseudouridine38-40 synthase
MRRFRLTLEYDGSGFEGWQVQRSGRTVQGALEEAIAEVTGRASRVYGAGRTDAGVHATGQVAHFDSATTLSADDLRRALNACLPDDVGVVEAGPASQGFDARRNALRKRYVYRVLNRTAPAPLRRTVTWHIRSPLDLERIEQATTLLIGERDFGAFRGAPGGAPPDERTTRKLERLEAVPRGDEVHFLAEGRSFLRYMVRNLVGTLVEVGRGALEPEAIPAILESRDRSRAGPTAPAQGLTLVSIEYPEAPS